MSNTNKYGLKRHIPLPVKMVIRQRCGFGCVKCGLFIFQYHHFNPPFEYAKTHKADAITLLCPNCHEELKKGLMTNNDIERYDSNPYCINTGYTSYSLNFHKNIEVKIGNISFSNTPDMITVFGKAILKIDYPEHPNQPFVISAEFYNSNGNEIAKINKNEWMGNTDSWDIKWEKSKFIIYERKNKISLSLQIDNSNNKILIYHLHLCYKGFRIEANEGQDTTVYLPDGSVWFTSKGKGLNISSCSHGILLE